MSEKSSEDKIEINFEMFERKATGFWNRRHEEKCVADQYKQIQILRMMLQSTVVRYGFEKFAFFFFFLQRFEVLHRDAHS